MKIEIEIKSGEDRHAKIDIRLLDGLKIIDSFDFAEERQLSERLLPSIDDLLKKNKLAVADIEEMTLISNVDESFTTYRIAKSVVDAFNWANKNKN